MKNTKEIRKKTKIGLICIILILLLIIIISFSMIDNSFAVVSKNFNNKKYKKSSNNQIDIENIVQENTKDIYREEIIKQEIDLEYTTEYRNNPLLPNGTIKTLQEGRDGKQEIIIKKSYINDELKEDEQIGTKITKASINKIVEVGTSNYIKVHKNKVGDTLYVTSTTLEVKVDPNIESKTIITIEKDDQVTLEEMQGEWYKLKVGIYSGWVNSSCLIYKEEKVENTETTSVQEKSASELKSSLNENIALNKPSGLSLEQFKKILQNDSNDKLGVFTENAEYFYYIEQQYNINGVFVAAVGIHESAWGTSKMAQNKKNLFGYGAYDRNPSDNAYVFKTYAEGIDLLARVFTKYYINPEGTKIYDGETAVGNKYYGSTIKGVNTKYATDKNWSNSVYKWMSYLYNKL